MTWTFFLIIIWVLTVLVAFFYGRYSKSQGSPDIEKKIESTAQKKKEEKHEEIENTEPHDTDKYVSDATNESISGAVESGKEKALDALRRLSDRNRKRRNNAEE